MARYFLDTSIYPTVPSMPIEMPYPRVIRVEGDLTPRSRIPSLIDPQDGISLQEALQQVANNTASSNATGEKSNTPLLLPTACDKNHGVAHAPRRQHTTHSARPPSRRYLPHSARNYNPKTSLHPAPARDQPPLQNKRWPPADP